jgi:hypothetical protein
MADTPADPTTQTNFARELGDLTATMVKAKDGAEAMAKAFSASAKQLADLKIAGVVEAVGTKAVADSFELYRSAVKKQEELDVGTVQTSALLERITGLNAIARKEMLKEADDMMAGNNMLQIGSNNMYKAIKDYQGATITLLDGTTAHATSVFKDVDGLFKTFNDSLADDTRLQAFAMKGLTYDLAETMRLGNENLNISTSTMNDIFQRELSETGKITGEALKDYEKSLVATAQLTGISVDLIGKDLSRMMSDFGHFGMMNKDQMLSLSVNLKQLGLDITDVTRLSDNFSSFDKKSILNTLI